MFQTFQIEFKTRYNVIEKLQIERKIGENVVKMYLREDEQDNTEKIIRAMRKFEKMCDRAGISKDFRKHEFYEKPSEKRKRQQIKNKMNFQRKMRELEGQFSNTPE